MPMTKYSGNTEIITNIGTTPQERGLTTDEFKAKFDEGLKAFVTWFNDTHKTEFDAHLALAGGTMSGEINMADNQLTRPEIKDYAETVGTTPATTGTVTFDLTTGNVFNLTPTGNVTIGFSDWPASGKAGSATVRLKNGSTVYSKTFAAAIKWVNDEIPDLSKASKAYDLVFSSTNAGTVIHGAAVGPYSA